MTIPPTQPNEPGAAPSPQAPGQAPAGGATPSYVTKEDFEAFQRQLKEELTKTSRVSQGAQSAADKLQNKVQAELQRINQTLTAFKAAGVQVTEQQANTMKQQALFDAFSQPSPDLSSAVPGQEQPGQPEGAGEELTPLQQQVTDRAFAIMESFGLEIEDADPEVQIIEKASQGSPPQFYQAVREACQAKQARLASPQQPPPNPSQPAARMPGLSGGGTGPANPIGSIKDPATLITMGLKGK